MALNSINWLSNSSTGGHVADTYVSHVDEDQSPLSPASHVSVIHEASGSMTGMIHVQPAGTDKPSASISGIFRWSGAELEPLTFRGRNLVSGLQLVRQPHLPSETAVPVEVNSLTAVKT